MNSRFLLRGPLAAVEIERSSVENTFNAGRVPSRTRRKTLAEQKCTQKNENI